MLFICTLEKCPQNYLICEACKQSEAQHVSTHANFICPYKQFFSYQSSKSISEYLPKIQKGLSDCEAELGQCRQATAAQMKAVNEDFDRLKQVFVEAEAKSRTAVMESYTSTCHTTQTKCASSTRGCSP